jgi:hypothetical protein
VLSVKASFKAINYSLAVKRIISREKINKNILKKPKNKLSKVEDMVL